MYIASERRLFTMLREMSCCIMSLLSIDYTKRWIVYLRTLFYLWFWWIIMGFNNKEKVIPTVERQARSYSFCGKLQPRSRPGAQCCCNDGACGSGATSSVSSCNLHMPVSIINHFASFFDSLQCSYYAAQQQQQQQPSRKREI
jgi:hypothetical protein